MQIFDLAFLAVVGFVVGATVWAMERIPAEGLNRGGLVARRPRLTAALWLVLSAVPTLFPVLSPAGPVPPQILMAVVLAAAIWFAGSHIGATLATWTPLQFLVGFQGFRLPWSLCFTDGWKPVLRHRR